MPAHSQPRRGNVHGRGVLPVPEELPQPAEVGLVVRVFPGPAGGVDDLDGELLDVVEREIGERYPATAAAVGFSAAT